MKPLPRDKSALYKEAISLGLLGPNPSVKEPRAKLIESIYSSMKIGRSFNHVSILLVGKTGVGKSATVNHLLAVNLAKVSGTETGTQSTKEYVVYGSDPEYEVKELPLGLIDTPGFCDTDGPKQDACNLLSIQKFFLTHPTLSKCYPNLILLFVNATDNRMSGKNSELEKSLRCIREFELIDHKCPNVVAILTHACSIQKPNGKEWAKEMDKRKSIVSKIVFNSLKIHAPIVLMENNYDDCCLKRRGDYTALPNENLQPENLYLACANVLQSNKDKLGLITLNSIFLHPKKGRRIVEEYELKAKRANQGANEQKIKDLVERFEAATRGDPIYDTISHYIEEQEPEAEEKEELMKIAGVLSQFSEGDPPNFGSLSIHTIEYLLDKEISGTGRNMLEQKFKIAVDPTGKVFESGYLVGQGYNIFTGESGAKQVMNFNVAMKYGIAIPVGAKFEKAEQDRSFMEEFKDEISYTQSRLKSLHLKLTVTPEIFNIDFRAGYNKSDFTTSSSTSEYSFLFEQRLFELKIGNYKELQNHGMTFTEDFKSDVAKLPSKYDKNNPSCVSKFERFFNRFGHFVVSSAYGGGSVEIKCSRDAVASTKTSLADVKFCLASTFEGWNVPETKLGAGGSSSEALLKLSTTTSSWNGGEAALKTRETILNKQKLKKWKESLIQNPKMLTSELKLEHISTAVGCVDDKKTKATYGALKDLLGSEIEIEEEDTQEEVPKPGIFSRMASKVKPLFRC